MLGSAGPATASTYTATTSATPSSPTRPSRLRGLSYLRNHLHSNIRPDTPPVPIHHPLLRSTSSPGVSSEPTAVASPLHPTLSSSSAERGNHDQHPHQAQHQAIPPPSTIQSAENGWIPTIQGRSGLSRESLHPTSTNTESVSPEPTSSVVSMTRSRTAHTLGPSPMANSTVRRTSAAEHSAAGETTMPGESSASTPTGSSKDQLPTIRFIPHLETRSSRPSLQFTAVQRVLKTPSSIIRVGRYSEKDNAHGDVVGFKSKVVSRRHCEFWCTDGQWFVKDVKSSSGTFLNHVRLSTPGAESRPYPVNDGDVVQLGIDFKGGEEVIFRCVKIRIECNRGWQKSLNNYNRITHERLIRSAKKAKTTRDSDAASVNSSECSICLNPVAPCQALFVAPCSHVWHFKCVRNYINGPNWPHFNCPNCRLVSDLEADIEPLEEDDLEDVMEEQLQPMLQHIRAGETRRPSETPSGDQSDDDDQQGTDSTPQNGHVSRNSDVDEDLSRPLQETSLGEQSPQADSCAIQSSHHRASSSALPLPGSSRPIDIAHPRSGTRTPSNPHDARSATPPSTTMFALSAGGPVSDGPMTPRNDAGPFVLDGSGGRDRIDNNLVSQAVAEVSEPNSQEERRVRK